MAKRKFSRDFLNSVTDREAEGVEIIREEPISHSRWDVGYETLFSYEGKVWKLYWSMGATESQDYSFFDYAPDEIECEEMVHVERTMMVWEAVK